MRLTADRSGERLDAFLARSLEDLSRSVAQKLIAQGEVQRNGRPAKKNDRLEPGDVIELELPQPQPEELCLRPQNIPLDIVYEDEDVLVLNKPKGLVVHPAAGHLDDTLVNGLLYARPGQLSQINGELRPGIVHRIDKDTSGLLAVAKNDYAHVMLASQLKDHSMARTYEAIVCGSFRADSGTVDAPIGRSPSDRKKMCVTDRNSREAVTHWQVIRRYRGYTHIRCRLETGRTHQIRVHMKHIGHKLFNDSRYGGDKILRGTRFSKYRQFVTHCFETCPRQALHAMTLGFVHPVTGEEMLFSSELPSDMAALLDRWRQYISKRE